MTGQFSSSEHLVTIGSDARGPVIVAILVFMGVAMLWLFTLSAGQEDHPERLYLAGRSLSPVLNGIATAGEQMSVVTLLAIPGAIALFGYDGFSFAIDGMLALGVMLLLGQKIRNSGCFTLGGIFSLRASGRAPRIAATVVTLVIAIAIFLIQLRAAGIAAAFLVGLSTVQAQAVCTVLMGLLAACCAMMADLRGTSAIHVVKVALTLMTLGVIVLLSLNKFDWDPGNLISAAMGRSIAPDQYFTPGTWQSGTFPRLDSFGMHVIEITGTAVLPHLILRISASRSGLAAQRSMAIASGIFAVFTFLLVTTGFAAAAVVGGQDIGTADTNGQSAPILLAARLFPDGSTARVALITVVACLAFLALLTTVASVTFAAAVSVVNDGLGTGKRLDSNAKQARALRPAIVLLCVVALAVSSATYRHFVDFLMVFVVSVAASAIFPALIYSFFWRRFNRRGLLWSVYGGLLLTSLFLFFSPSVSGSPYSLFPARDFHWFPFMTPGLCSVPAAFLLGWIGSITSRSTNRGSGPAQGAQGMQEAAAQAHRAGD